MVNSIKDVYYKANQTITEHTSVETGMFLGFWQKAWFLVDSKHIKSIESILSILIIVASFALLLGLYFFGLKFKKFYNVFFTTFILINLHFGVVNYIAEKIARKENATSFNESYNPGVPFYNTGIYLKDKINHDTITNELVEKIDDKREKFYKQTELEFLEKEKINNLHGLLTMVGYAAISSFLSIKYNSMLPLAFFTILTCSFRVFYVLSFSKMENSKYLIIGLTILTLLLVTYFARFITNFLIAFFFSLISSVYLLLLIGIVVNRSDYVFGFWTNLFFYSTLYNETKEISLEYIKWIFIVFSMFCLSFFFNLYTGGKKGIMSK
ncbi:hypothetical protein EHP00_1256 [Ecytonucleospora hepatopenaei]|uniref:Uncharacterized protein n=1 Tax=Ecytonucleospora hepatopenaei TaxID=646526 RepID=A0A1W0E3F0_9MICR|nr:hypothetical protein EHP00_1256 [Ecytonucleospora hepatopenaei]